MFGRGLNLKSLEIFWFLVLWYSSALVLQCSGTPVLWYSSLTLCVGGQESKLKNFAYQKGRDEIHKLLGEYKTLLDYAAGARQQLDIQRTIMGQAEVDSAQVSFYRSGSWIPGSGLEKKWIRIYRFFSKIKIFYFLFLCFQMNYLEKWSFQISINF